MTTVFSLLVVVVLAAMVPFIGRVIVGPTIFDRAQALNGMGTLIPVLLVLVGLIYQRAGDFVDLVLALFILNLFATLLIARYTRHRAEEAK